MAYVRDENGNLKKTVRCSYCGQTGHSRRTCHYLHPNGTPAQQRAKRRAADKEQRRLERQQRKQDKAAGKEVAKITVGADIVASKDTLGGIAKCSQQTRLD